MQLSQQKLCNRITQVYVFRVHMHLGLPVNMYTNGVVEWKVAQKLSERDHRLIVTFKLTEYFFTAQCLKKVCLILYTFSLDSCMSPSIHIASHNN